MGFSSVKPCNDCATSADNAKSKELKMSASDAEFLGGIKNAGNNSAPRVATTRTVDQFVLSNPQTASTTTTKQTSQPRPEAQQRTNYQQNQPAQSKSTTQTFSNTAARFQSTFAQNLVKNFTNGQSISKQPAMTQNQSVKQQSQDSQATSKPNQNASKSNASFSSTPRSTPQTSTQKLPLPSQPSTQTAADLIKRPIPQSHKPDIPAAPKNQQPAQPSSAQTSQNILATATANTRSNAVRTEVATNSSANQARTPPQQRSMTFSQILTSRIATLTTAVQNLPSLKSLASNLSMQGAAFAAAVFTPVKVIASTLGTLVRLPGLALATFGSAIIPISNKISSFFQLLPSTGTALLQSAQTNLQNLALQVQGALQKITQTITELGKTVLTTLKNTANQLLKSSQNLAQKLFEKLQMLFGKKTEDGAEPNTLSGMLGRLWQRLKRRKKSKKTDSSIIEITNDDEEPTQSGVIQKGLNANSRSGASVLKTRAEARS